MPTTLELMLPWELSPTVLISVTLTVALYLRGAVGGAPSAPRRVAFFAGVGIVYLALQTALEYYASHMFFVMQLQHFALHDLGPALLAAAAPGAALSRGLPQWARTRLPMAARMLRSPLKLLLDIRLATVSYVVTQLVWLLPPITFDVMLNDQLFRIMSWITVLGGLPFWHLMLDPRSYPASRLRLRYRFAALYVAMFPMVLTSAALAFSQTNWYPVYAVCGRFLPISPVMDQELGGMAMWVPGALLFGTVFFQFIGRRLEQAEKEHLRCAGGRATERPQILRPQ